MKNLIIPVLVLMIFLRVMSNGQSNITYDAGAIIDISAGADVCADNIIINGTYAGSGTICNGVMPVALSSFTFTVSKNNVKLIWVTSEEINNSGFDIERQKTENNWQKIGFVHGSGTTNEPKTYFYEDKQLQAATYKYRLKQIDFNGNFEYYGLDNDVIVGKPNEFSISQNYPNPSNPKSKIDYQVPFDGKVTLKIYDVIGREVVTLINEVKEAGYYTAEFDGSNLSSGVYFYRIFAKGNSEDYNKTLKMVLVK